MRIGMAEGKPYVEDLNSLNGTLLDGEEVPQFQPVPLAAGQELTLGRVVLEVARRRLEATGGQPHRLDLEHVGARRAGRRGVFGLLLVMLMPYYRKTMDAEAEIEAVRVAAAESLAEVHRSKRSPRATAPPPMQRRPRLAAELQARATALEQAARQRLRPTPVVQEGPDPKCRRSRRSIWCSRSIPQQVRRR